MFKKYFFALFFVCFLGCDKENENLKIGTFRFYEGDEFIGYIYRFKNYQVEEYKKDILFANLEWKDSNTCLIKGVNQASVGLDSINFLMIHKKVNKNKYEIEAIPVNVKLNHSYSYRAVLEKESSKVVKFLDTLKSLNLTQ